MMLSTIYNAIISLLETLCALGNLCLLIYFTNRQWHYSKDQDDKRKSEAELSARLDRQKLWYDKIVIERIISNILEYFDSTIDVRPAVKPKDEQQKKEHIHQITTITKRYKHLMIPCLDIFSHTLTRNINRLIQDYQDILINEIASADINYTYNFDRKLNTKKGEILKTIYEYDFQHNLSDHP